MTSKSQINRAGDILKNLSGNSVSHSSVVELSALKTVEDFRSSFKEPLTKVNNGLRSFISGLNFDVYVTQRLKRMPQIIHKLERLPSLKLSRMQDIAGCRAVLASLDQVYHVADRIEERWEIRGKKDYISEPRTSGYRALHLIVLRDEKLVEIQLRTQLQQNWASVVEDIAAMHDLPLKDESGPQEIMDWLRLAAMSMGFRDKGMVEPDELRVQFEEFTTRALEWMEVEGKNG